MGLICIVFIVILRLTSYGDIASPEVLHNGPKGLAHSGSNQKKKKKNMAIVIKKLIITGATWGDI